MGKCKYDEKDLTTAKFGAKFGVGVITIIYIFFIMFVIGFIIIIRKPSIITSQKQSAPPVPITYEDNFTGRFNEWFTKAGTSINFGSILAILAAGVVIGFNSLIMTPIITTMFPKSINEGMAIPGKNTTVNPGQFLIALVGFIISLILFFFVAELIYLIRKRFKESLNVIIITVLFVFLTFMLVWNAMELDSLLKQPDCVPLDKKVNVFQMKQSGLDQPKFKTDPSPAQFGVFGT